MPPPGRALSRWAWAADAMLAVSLAVSTVDGAVSRHRDTRCPRPAHPAPTPAGLPVAPMAPVGHALHYGPVAPWQLALAALTALPLIARRRYPLAAFWVVISANIAYHLSPGFDPTFTFIACVIAAYSAALYSRYQVLAISSALVGAGVIVGDHASNVPAIRPGFVPFLFLIPIGLTANLMHTWQQRVRTLEAEQEAATRHAVEAGTRPDRARAARRRHPQRQRDDGAGRRRPHGDGRGTRPGPRRHCSPWRPAGRAAMAELRHVMGLLTMNGDNPEPAPATDSPLSRVSTRSGSSPTACRGTGVPVDLTVTGTSGPLPRGVDLAAYRVVQEALTNALKHAAGAHVTIVVDSAAARVCGSRSPTPAAPARSAGPATAEA